jgi:hypothetical protein
VHTAYTSAIRFARDTAPDDSGDSVKLILIGFLARGVTGKWITKARDVFGQMCEEFDAVREGLAQVALDYYLVSRTCSLVLKREVRILCRRQRRNANMDRMTYAGLSHNPNWLLQEVFAVKSGDYALSRTSKDPINLPNLSHQSYKSCLCIARSL